MFQRQTMGKRWKKWLQRFDVPHAVQPKRQSQAARPTVELPRKPPRLLPSPGRQHPKGKVLGLKGKGERLHREKGEF